MKIRGATTGARACALTMLAVLAACGGESPREVTTRRRSEPIATFIADVNPVSGTLTVTPLGGDPLSSALTYWTGLQPITTAQNGAWGDAGEGTVELRNVGTPDTVPGGCGPGIGSFEGSVEIRSGFQFATLRNVFVEITSISLPVRESCYSDPPPGLESGVADTNGLFAYGDIGPHATQTARWSFRVPDQTPFTFVGRVMAEVVEGTLPVTTATPSGGATSPGVTYPAPQPIALSCSDAGGCADTVYRVDGGPEQRYAAPIRLSGTQRLCYRSTDLAGNPEAERCEWYTITAAPVAAFLDDTLEQGAARCTGLARSCDSGTIVVEPESIPHTIDDCADGDNRTLQTVDWLRVRTVEDGPFAAGAAVVIDVTVTPEQSFFDQDTLELFYTDVITQPVTWQHLQTITFATPETQTVSSAPWVLPAGVRAIRARMGWTPTVDACAGTPYEDRDDLVFDLDAAPPGAGAPTVSFTAPSAGATISRTALLTADATDDVSVAAVEFGWRRAGTTDPFEPIGTDESPPWAVAWATTATASFGDVELQAIARDHEGNPSAPATVTVTVADRTPPTGVAVVAPASGANVSRLSTPSLSATAVDPRGVTFVDFYVDGVRVATATTESNGTFSTTWGSAYALPPSAFADGPHTIYVRAQDGIGNVTRSVPVSFTIFTP